MGAVPRKDDPAARKLGDDIMQAAYKLDPKDESVRIRVADSLASVGSYREALDILEKLPPDNARNLEMAKLYIGLRLWDDADKRLDAVVAAATDKAAAKSARRLRADAASWRGGEDGHKKALERFDELIKEYPADADLKVRYGEVLVWSQQYDKAIDWFQTLADAYPADERVWAGFAHAAARIKAPLTEKNLATLAKIGDLAAAGDSKNTLLLAHLATALYKTGDKDKAIALAERVQGCGQEAGHAGGRRRGPRTGQRAADGRPVQGGARDVRLVRAEDARRPGDVHRHRRRGRAVRPRPQGRAGQLRHGQEDRRGARGQAAARPGAELEGRFRGVAGPVRAAGRRNAGRLGVRMETTDVTLWWENYGLALQKYATLLSERFEEAKLWTGFIDAASSTPRISPPHKELLLKVHDRIAPSLDDPLRLSRLAWVMHRIDEPKKADALLDKARAINPPQPAVRKELAGVFAARERYADAVAMLQPFVVYRTLDVKDRVELSKYLTASGSFTKAEQELRAFVTDKSEKELRVALANVLLWGGKYEEAQTMFSKLLRDYPDDDVVQLRLGQAYLWNREYPVALDYFTKLGAKYEKRIAAETTDADPVWTTYPDVWRGLIDSAAGTAGESLRSDPSRPLAQVFTGEQRRLLTKTYDATWQVHKRTKTEDVKQLAETIGRLGLVTGLLGDRDRSGKAFGAALKLDKANRQVWLQYAQVLTYQGNHAAARAIYEPLIASQKEKPPGTELIPPTIPPATDGKEPR